MSNSLPFTSITNDILRLDFLTTMGPRIIGLYVKGAEGNLLASTPEVHWATPHGEYYLLGGHRLWIAPEDPFYTCPEGRVDVAADKSGVVLRSRVDASGLEKEIAFRLDGNHVRLSHRVTWHGASPITLAAWAITQLRLGGMTILPLPSDRNGLQPNRNLVYWPYSKIHDERLELHDDLILVHGWANDYACKIGNKNMAGWMAYALSDALFIKEFAVDGTKTYPDLDCNVEVYIKDVCLELETLGPLVSLDQGESVVHEETWQVLAGEYPASMDGARKVKKLLSRSL